MICSASDLSSSGLSGAVSSPTRSPFTRMVAGRPTLSSRSEPLRCTMCVIACLKLNAGRLLCVASPMRIHPEKDLAEFHRLRVLSDHLANHARDLGFDLVHDLHGFDDADDLTDVHPTPDLHVGLRGGLGRLIEGAHHRRLDLTVLGTRGWGLGAGCTWRRRGGAPRNGCSAGMRDDHGPPPPQRLAVPRLGDPDRGPGPEQTAPDLDRPHLRRILQDLHDLRDDVELHAVKIPPLRPYTSSMRSVQPSVNNTGPSADKCTSSSIRTPPRPVTYTPGSIVTTASSGNGSAEVRDSRGASCTSRPRPCPVECPNAAPKPRASIGSRASASASLPLIPARTPSRARRCASCTRLYSARCPSS